MGNLQEMGLEVLIWGMDANLDLKGDGNGQDEDLMMVGPWLWPGRLTTIFGD